MKYNIEIKTDEVFDKEEVKQVIIDSLKSELDYKQRSVLQRIAREVVTEIVTEIATKDFKKELKQLVKLAISTFERTDLTYRDEYRSLLVESAKKNQKLIDEKVKMVIETGDSNIIYDALGSSVADKFYSYIRNENN